MRNRITRGWIASGIAFGFLVVGTFLATQRAASFDPVSALEAAISGKNVAIFEEHGWWRQTGFMLARYTAPALAEEAVILYAYPFKDFPVERAADLQKSFKDQKVSVGFTLETGGYAVVPPSLAKDWGILHYDDIAALTFAMQNNSDLFIVSSEKAFLDTKDSATISYWNDPWFAPDAFVKEHRSDLNAICQGLQCSIDALGGKGTPSLKQ